MRRNILKQSLKAGETAIGSMVQEMTTPTVAQVFKQAGFDFFMIDGEHSPYSLETAGEIIRVGRLLDMCPLMRVKGPEYDLIAGALDIGAMGVMLPRVEAPHHVETLLDCMKYPPMGHRGLSSDAPHSEYDFGPLDEFVEVNNLDTMAIVQIERKAAIAAALRERVWPLIEAGRIKPVVHATFPLAQAAEAHRLMESGAHIGKIMLTV